MSVYKFLKPYLINLCMIVLPQENGCHRNLGTVLDVAYASRKNDEKMRK